MKKTAKKEPNTINIEKILKDLTVDENGPGTILRDFEAALDFIIEQTPSVSPKTKVLTGKNITELNSRLTEPLKTDLKRPVQKSYPNVNGLFLLLRTTQIVKVDAFKKKFHLTADDKVLQSWRSLNPAEKYFTLLEAWLVKSSLETVGESDTVTSRAPLIQWKNFVEMANRKDIITSEDVQIFDSIRYTPGFTVLFLLNLFGFIDLEFGDPAPGKGFNLVKIQKNALGKAFLRFFTDEKFVSYGEIFAIFCNADSNTENEPFGKTQKLFSPYFKDWKNNLALPEKKITEGVFILNVSLGRVYRKFAVPGDLDFESLANAILNRFDFDHDHLYSFIYKDGLGKKKSINHYYMDDPPLAHEIRIKEVFLRPGQTMTFLYDFGDNWEFQVTLEKIDPPDPELEEPRLIEKKGTPPEQYPVWDDDDDYDY